jgi:hypothetical protein
MFIVSSERVISSLELFNQQSPCQFFVRERGSFQVTERNGGFDKIEEGGRKSRSKTSCAKLFLFY